MGINAVMLSVTVTVSDLLIGSSGIKTVRLSVTVMLSDLLIVKSFTAVIETTGLSVGTEASNTDILFSTAY